MIDTIGNGTIEEEWNKSERGDWMLWFYQRLYPSNEQEHILASRYCAKTVKHLMNNYTFAIQALFISKLFAEGKVSRYILDRSRSEVADESFRTINCDYLCPAINSAEASVDIGYRRWIHNSASFSARAIYEKIIYQGQCPPDYESYAHKQRVINRAKKAIRENQQITADICRKYLKINKMEIK